MPLRVLVRIILSVMTALVLADIVSQLDVRPDQFVQSPYGPLKKCSG